MRLVPASIMGELSFAPTLTPSDIRYTRSRLGLSEVEFGRALRLEDPRKKVREFENGSRTPSPQIVALIDALVRVHDLESIPSPP